MCPLSAGLCISCKSEFQKVPSGTQCRLLVYKRPFQTKNGGRGFKNCSLNSSSLLYSSRSVLLISRVLFSIITPITPYGPLATPALFPWPSFFLTAFIAPPRPSRSSLPHHHHALRAPRPTCSIELLPSIALISCIVPSNSLAIPNPYF